MLWRETGRTLKVVGVDARVLTAIPLWGVYATWTTFGLVIFFFVFFFVLNQLGYTFPNAMRRLRVLVLFGNRRPAMPFWRKREWR
jgi:hypothetical protein